MLSNIPIVIHPIEYIYVKDAARAESIRQALLKQDEQEKEIPQ